MPLSLFNLRADPEERCNLATGREAPDFADRIARVKRLLDQWWPGNDESHASVGVPSPNAAFRPKAKVADRSAVRRPTAERAPTLSLP
jgi:hypothetical protein